MSPDPHERCVPPACRQLAERCRALGLPMWCWDEDGWMILEPVGWGPVDSWLRSPLLQQRLADAAERWTTETPPRLHELFAGCWLLPVVHLTPDHRNAVVVAMALGYEALEREEFAQICAAGKLDPMITRTAVLPVARFRKDETARLATAIQWMHADLIRAAEDGEALRTFSQQLGETYEQISLLYRLSAAVSDLDAPYDNVRMAVNLLHDTLDFQWVAAKFSRFGSSVGDPAIVAGDVPCPRRQFENLAGNTIVPSRDTQSWTVLQLSEDPLAARVEGEVIVAPLTASNQVEGVLLVGNKRGDGAEVNSVDTQLVNATAGYLGTYLESAWSYLEQRAMFLGTVRAMTSSIEANDRYTRGHSERVAFLAAALATARGLDDTTLQHVRLAGLLHDVGKIGIPGSVLRKAGQLTDEEFELIKRHPSIGYNILKDIEPLKPVLPGVLYHHERWDGKGYPSGLTGDETPMLARILAVADMFDAMSSARAYRGAIAPDKVLAEVRAEAGVQLDPDLAATFLTLDFSEYFRLIEMQQTKDRSAAA